MNHPHNHFYACSEKHFPGIVWASIICHTLTAITILLPPKNVQAAETPARNVPTVTHSRKTYNIAAGPLETVLNHFGREAGILLTFSPDTTADLQSTGLQGSYTLQEGLDRLLIGSNLYAVHDAKGKYSLHKLSKTSIAGENATLLTEMTVTGVAIDSGVTEGTGSYTTSQSSFGKGQNLKELPQTVTVMTRQRIDDQGLKMLDDVLERTPGITVQKENTVSSSFYSRGFRITSFQIDGNSPMHSDSNQTYGLNTSQLDLAMFDSLEVLRGSDALYGTSGEPGGAINLVRKKPTKQFQVKALAHAGSWNNYRGELDIGGSIMGEGRIRGRLVGVYENRKYFYDYSKSDKTLFFGIVEADITNSTMLTVGGDILHQNFDGINTFGLPRYSNGEDIGLRRSYYLGGPDDRWLRKNNKQFVRLDQAIGTNWTLGIEASRAESNNYRRDMSWYEAINPITLTGSSTFRDREFDYDETQKTLDAVLKGSFHFLGHEHKVILGTNINKRNYHFSLGNRNSNFTLSPNIFAFNPFEHVSNAPYILTSSGNTKIMEKGVYGSFVAQITDPLKLIVGGRISWYDYEEPTYIYDRNTGIINYTELKKYEDNKVFTPYLGMVYDLTKQWSTYASITETYKPQAEYHKGPLPSAPLTPVTGRSYEIGVKGGLFNNRLNTALAFYSIKLNGQASQDPNYPPTPAGVGGNCCYLGDGHITSRGIDIEVSGEIVNGWQILAGYTFNNNENKTDSGRYSTVTPKHLFKLWSSYAFRGAFEGLKFGGGITAQSSYYQKGSARTFSPATDLYDGPSTPYEFTEPGRVLVDLFAQYHFNKHWSATANINNIFDKKYYQTVANTNPSAGNFYGEPRNFLLSMRYSY